MPSGLSVTPILLKLVRDGFGTKSKVHLRRDMRKKNIYKKIEENGPGYKEADPDSETKVTVDINDREYLDYIESKKKNNTPKLNNIDGVPANLLN